jgi:predicted enzyme related to lactoylglutathione lyase
MVNIPVPDLNKARDFYDKVFSLLGYRMMKVENNWRTGLPRKLGYGTSKKPSFWLALGTESRELPPVEERSKIVFQASTVELIDAFFAGALASGGTEIEAPERKWDPGYESDFYRAHVTDPFGNYLVVGRPV